MNPDQPIVGTGSGNGQSAPAAPVADNEFLAALQETLLGKAGVASSETSQIDQTIQDTIDTLTKGSAAAQEGTRAAFERQRVGVRQQGTEDLIATSEATQNLGAASSYAVLQRVTEATDKNLKDLDLREKEALAAGQNDLAKNLANLKLQQLQFKTEAEQRTFQNLLAAAGFSLQVRGQEQQDKQFQLSFGLQKDQLAFQQQQAMGQIALDYGIELKAGDTIDTVVARAKPFASEQQKLQLESIRADIAAKNAQAAESRANANKILREGSGAMDAATLDIIAQAANKNPAILGLLKDPKQAALIIQRQAALSQPREWSDSEIENMAQLAKNSNTPYYQALSGLAAEATLTNKDKAKEILKRVYNITDKVRKDPFGGQLSGGFDVDFKSSGGFKK